MIAIDIDTTHIATPVAFYQQEQSLSPYMQKPTKDFLSIFSRNSLWAEVASAKAKIQEFGSMKDGWDGYGALPISAVTVENSNGAMDLLLRFAPVPDIVPNSNGTISFEWETAHGFAHLEIGKTRFSFYLKLRAGAPTSLSGDANNMPSEVGEIISALLFPAPSAASTTARITMAHDVRPSY